MLKVKSDSYIDNTKIWGDEEFPVRFNVELVYQLKPENAIPVLELRDKLSIFKDLKSPNSWIGHVRGSPAEFTSGDGEAIIAAIKDAMINPVKKEYDPKKYYCSPKTYESKGDIFTVPEEKKPIETSKTDVCEVEKVDKTTHEEIQYLLLKLGSDMGMDVWVAKNDRNKAYNGVSFQNIPRLRNDIPRQFDDVTNKTIELIDVLWLQGDAILAAFEVEHTTSIYSGLLRMSDLVSMQPNIKLNLYIVAPDDRRINVINEINRPTFAKLKSPLPKICKFIPYSTLKKEIEIMGSRIRFMKMEFIDEIAEGCEVI